MNSESSDVEIRFDEIAMVNFFKALHQHPELSNEEFWTTAQIRKIIEGLGITELNYGLSTGLVAEIKGGLPGPTIALRADIDALPITEKTDLSYRSKVAHVAHACGHDFHTAALLGAAAQLQNQASTLKGNVRLLFEPGEERHTGAKTLIASGAMTDVAAIFGIHNMPYIPVGTVGIKVGKLMASNDNFNVTINGVGSHAAMPHTGRDPIVTAAAIIMALQTIVSRNTDPQERLVVTIGAIEGGDANNVIPHQVTFKGTIRAFSAESRALAKRRLNQIVISTAESFDQSADIEWDHGPASVNNNQKVTELVAKVAESFMTVVPAKTTNADDDFASFEEVVPGCYAFLGSHGQANLHHEDFIANPEALKYGVRLHVEVAKRMLDYLNSGLKF